MRTTTEVFYKFESTGRPKETESAKLPVRDVIMAFAKWITRVDMGGKLKITIARNLADLENSRVEETLDINAELEAYLTGFEPAVFESDSDGIPGDHI